MYPGSYKEVIIKCNILPELQIINVYMRSLKLPISVKFFYKDTEENELNMYIYLVSIYTNECYKYIILQYNLNIKHFIHGFFLILLRYYLVTLTPPPSRNLKKKSAAFVRLSDV